MTEVLCSGLNWSVTDALVDSFGVTDVHTAREGRFFKIFDTAGGTLGNGNYVFPSGLGLQHCETEPTPISGDLLQIIETDRANGYESKLDYIGIMPYVALRLALEGILTMEALQLSQETPGSITTTVNLDGTYLKLVIGPGLEYNLASYNCHGNVV